MARKNSYGKYILSAGEISSYTVCPQAWRLNLESDVKPVHSETVDEGNRLHEEWTRSFQDAMYFTRSIKLILLLTVLTILFFLLRFIVDLG